MAIIIIIFVAMYLGMIKANGWDEDIEGAVIFGFISSVTSLLIFGIMYGAIDIYYDKVNGYVYDTATKPIYSASLNHQAKGTFTLGSGVIDSESYYYFYTKNNEGLKLDKVEADETSVVLDDKEKPHLEIKLRKYKNGFLLWLLYPFGRNDKYNGFFEHGYKLFVPKNAIVESYNLNL